MKAVKIFAIGAGSVLALAGASAPAAAQMYPGYPGYGSPYGYGYGDPYGYGYDRSNERFLVQQCTTAVQQRLNNYGYGGYNPYGYGNGYGYGRARVLGVTRIDRRTPGVLRIRGEASSGMNYGYGDYGYGGYGYGGGYGGYGAPADLTFRCDVDFRGYIRGLDIDRRRY